MSSVDRQSEALAEAGEGAALAVSQGGTIVVTSAEEGTVTTLAPAGRGLRRGRDRGPARRRRPGLRRHHGRRARRHPRRRRRRAQRRRRRRRASVPPAACSSRPAPPTTPCWSARPTALLSVDLDSGEVTTIVATARGDRGRARPPRRLRLRRLVGRRRVRWRVQCGRRRPTEHDLGGDATQPRVPGQPRRDRPQRRQQRHRLGRRRTTSPVRIDNWEAFTSKKKNKDDENENENQSDADRRPPAGQARLLRRPRRPYDGPAPARQRLGPRGPAAEHRRRRPAHRRRPRGDQPRRPDPRPADARRRPGPRPSTTSSTTAATGCRAHATVSVDVRDRRGQRAAGAARGLPQADLPRAARRRARRAGARRLARRPRRRHAAPRLGAGRGRRRVRAPRPAPPPTAGSASPPRRSTPTARSRCASSSP